MIGIFDSGVGGLTSVKELLRTYPSADFRYLGDTARAPYGDKSVETINQYAAEDAHFLINRGVKDIAIACNIVSAVALDNLRTQYPTTNFYGVIEPTVMAVADKAPQRIGVLGTRATIASGIYEQKIKEVLPSSEIMSVACPLFVPWVEEGFADYPETKLVAEHYLGRLRDFQPDVVILGCTHYPFLEREIQQALGPKVVLVSSSKELISHLPPELFEDNQKNRVLHFTDLASHTQELAYSWVDQGIEVEQVKL